MACLSTELSAFRREGVIVTQENQLHFDTDKRSIVVVDDSEDHALIVQSLLEADGFEVITVSSGHNALELLGSIERPSLILLDYSLGDMLGSELLLLLEQSQTELMANVPIVFMSAMDEIPASKAIGMIRKPFDFDQFLKTVRHCIEFGRMPQSNR